VVISRVMHCLLKILAFFPESESFVRAAVLFFLSLYCDCVYFMFHLSLFADTFYSTTTREAGCVLSAPWIRFYVVITHPARSLQRHFFATEMPTGDVLGCDLTTDGLFHGEPAAASASRFNDMAKSATDSSHIEFC
jgi:hypothetical protein